MEGLGLLGMFGSNVCGLGEVVFQIVEFEGTGAVLLHENVLSLSNGAVFSGAAAVVVWVVPEETFATQARFRIAKNGGEADSVDVLVVGGHSLDAGDVEEGWVVVDADNRFFADAARLSDAWPFDDGGDSCATFVSGAFTGSERNVFCRIAIAVETSVVAGQEDQGVLSLADFFQLLHDSPNTFIHAFDHGSVGGIVVTAFFAIIQMPLYFSTKSGRPWIGVCTL